MLFMFCQWENKWTILISAIVRHSLVLYAFPVFHMNGFSRKYQAFGWSYCFCPWLYKYGILYKYGTMILQGVGKLCCLSVLYPILDFSRWDNLWTHWVKGWNLLQSTPNVKLLLGQNQHECQIIILACIIVIFNIVLQDFKIG